MNSSTSGHERLSLRESLSVLLDRRFLTIFVLGFSSGFPWVLHGSVLTLWMQSEGLSRSAIGYIGAVASLYALNWMWSPFIDKLRIPLLHRRFGQRRSWILLTQGLIVLGMLAMSRGDPGVNLWLIGACALFIAACSATQDIAVDAYRITLFAPEEADRKLPYSSAMTTVGWYAGYGFIGGALALWLGGEGVGLAWARVYQVLALVYLALMALVALSPSAWEPPPQPGRDFLRNPRLGAVGNWFLEHVAAPFTEFFTRCGFKLALVILLFLFSFRLGEAMLGRMSLVFYVELGFSTEQIALYQKFLGGLATVVFALMGALLNTRYGVVRGMLVGGIAMASSNLLYALMAQVGPEPWLFMLTLLVDNFTQAFATVAAISFMSYFSSRTYTGTQFALMTSFSNFGRTTLAAGSGALVDGLGGNWPLFFVLTTLAVIPALGLLLYLAALMREYRSPEQRAEERGLGQSVESSAL